MVEKVEEVKEEKLDEGEKVLEARDEMADDEEQYEDAVEDVRFPFFSFFSSSSATIQLLSILGRGRPYLRSHAL